MPLKHNGYNSASILGRMKSMHEEMKKARSANSLLDEVETEKFIEIINRIIFRAARKVKDHPEIENAPDITHNNDLLKKARDFFIRLFKLKRKELKKLGNDKQLTADEIANMALLGVLSVSQTGTVQIYLQTGSRHSNYYGVADQAIWRNPFNYSALMSEDVADFTQGDSLGLEAEAVEESLKRGGALLPEIIEFFEANGFITVQEHDPKKENQERSQSKSCFTTPELRPPIQFTEDEGDSD